MQKLDNVGQARGKSLKYVRLSTGISKYDLVPADGDDFAHINPEKDHYRSIFYYNEDQYKRFKETGTIAGIKDVTTNRLVWDFDSKDNLEAARKDAVTLCDRLMDEGFPPDSIQVAFSGSKGYCVEVEIDREITPEQFRHVNQKLAEGLSTNDTQILDPARIIRVAGTKHQKSGLYKLPISVRRLTQSSSDEIKSLAADLRNAEWEENAVARVPEALIKLPPPVKKLAAVVDAGDVDFRMKPKGFTNCKFAILNGMFPNGVRNNSLKALAATCKAQNYPKEVTYRMLKGAAELQMKRYGSEPFAKEEIWNTIIETTYSPTHNGGQYSCRNQPWLKEICDSLGPNKCKHEAAEVAIKTDDVFNLFENYAVNFEKNALTTGIEQLDRRVKLLVGTSNGVLAPPGAGKTSMSLTVLNHNSKQGVQSVFFSYDMFHSLLYLRLVQKHTGLSQDRIFDILKHNKKETGRIRDIISQEYKNVHFCFKSGQSADEIEQTIGDIQDKTGEKVKLAIIDYNELVSTTISDPTQSSAYVAQRLRQIANDKEVCIATLLQPSKVFSNPAEEISTYQGAKGSGAIAQSLTLMLSLSRPGFHPRRPEDDRFFTINALKNRNGPLFTVDLGWDGLTGAITELSPEDEIDLRAIRERKSLEKEEEGDSW